jgi:hypothetical protein
MSGSFDIQASVEKMIEDGFNVTMVWDKFISDVQHQSMVSYSQG